jgi:hypothetical protein
MPKQACLDLRGDRLEELWRRLPKRARGAVIEEYARLIARGTPLESCVPGWGWPIAKRRWCRARRQRAGPCPGWPGLDWCWGGSRRLSGWAEGLR